MLLFSDRRNVPWEYLAFEVLLIVCAGSIMGTSAVLIARLWIDVPWTFRWALDWIALAGVPLMALWIYFDSDDRDPTLPGGAFVTWLMGIVFAVAVHYAVVLCHVWRHSHAYF